MYLLPLEGVRGEEPSLWEGLGGLLQRYSILENGNLAISVDLITCRFTACNSKDLVDELRNEFLHCLAVNELSGIEVYPVLLAIVEVGVRGNLHRRDESAERSSATSREEYQMASCGSKCRGCNEVIARSREKVETRSLQAVTVFKNSANWSTSAFLRASESLVLKSRDTTSLVAR